MEMLKAVAGASLDGAAGAELRALVNMATVLADAKRRRWRWRPWQIKKREEEVVQGNRCHVLTRRDIRTVRGRFFSPPFD
jgi:hypothetical protein